MYFKKLLLFFFFLVHSTSLFGEVKVQSLKKDIVLLGAVPVMSSFILVLKQAEFISNDLPFRFKNQNISHKLYEKIIHPKEKGLLTYGVDFDVNLELLLQNHPDYIFTMDKTTKQNLAKLGLNSFHLNWKNEDDIEKTIFFLADILDAKEQAINYINYSHYVTKTIQNKLKKLPNIIKPKVLCFDYKSMSSAHHIIDSWIENSGGISVTKSSRIVENISFSVEQILVWNPDIIILTNQHDVEALYNDKKFTGISAIQNKKIFVSPRGIHSWVYRTAEFPLMKLWSAKIFYPELFQDIEMEKEILSFYKNLIGYDISAEEIDEILNLSSKKEF